LILKVSPKYAFLASVLLISSLGVPWAIILQFDKNSRLVWKKNYYTKSEKKLDPILQFANNNQFLIVADNLTKYYKLNLDTGDIIWSKKNLAPFNSQIKIYKDRFFVVDITHTLRCFSL